MIKRILQRILQFKRKPSERDKYVALGHIYPRQNLINAAEWISKGQASLKSGSFQEAVNSFSRVIELDPKNGVAYYQRGLTHYKLGDKKQAMNDLKSAARLGYKKSIEFLNSIGIDW